ncbi:GNAT family N-acetyltransferase [Paenibacillus spongiae]|uniref:GNAT family N-acetyltransferase n=1 Tax=Paenibacillus spongiae TaxID=2909671 RepID=A0ABY5S9T4_9BACL|nr:GNAT family N-acetyltransferase [Paenibacillus spongiae]UVI29478.1 GNAT family N-acetyltransferase [Paenibacillus spongiae]
MDVMGGMLELTRITEADVEFICKVECDADLWFFEEEVETDKHAVREKYLHRIKEDAEQSHYDFIVTLKTDQSITPIGLAQVWSYIEFRKSWEIGFAILPEYSGHGYGREAARRLLKFAFDELQAHKVIGMCNAMNKRSAALMERIGMRKEGVFKEELFWREQWTDQNYYSILDNEFLHRNNDKTA